MSVKHNKRESIIDALNKAQHIAFGPVLFQAVRAALNTGFLHRLAQTNKKPRAPSASRTMPRAC